MKVVIINGSPRKYGNGSRFIEKIIAQMEKDPSIGVRVINLCEKDIKMCKGCQLCYEKGEDSCPLKDDVSSIKQEMLDCSGIIFYSPTYVVNMSGIMKNFIDRLSYICHRPAFFKKTAFLLTTTGSGGGAYALKCLKWPLLAWGFRIVKSVDIKMSKYNYDITYKSSVDKTIGNSVQAIIEATKEERASQPNIIELIGFKIKKQNYFQSKNVHKYDVEYWRQKGWLDKEAKYFFPLEKRKLNCILASLLAPIIKLVM